MLSRTGRMVGFCATLCTAAALARADAIAVWHLDEAPGATSAADSAGNHPGTLFGSAAFETGGISGNCIHVTIAGNGYVDMGDYFRFAAGDFALVAWGKTAPDDHTPDYFILCKHRSTIAEGYLVGINANGGYGAPDKAWFYQDRSPANDLISTTSVNDGAWHQIVVVYRAGRQTRLYVDGAPFEDARPASPIIGNDAHFALAAIDFGGTLRGVLNGWIDEVQLYPHHLTDNQVQYLFDHPSETVLGPLGDTNCDGAVDFSDINPFVLALSDPAGYHAAFPNCAIRHADVNYDGVIDFDDINAFVAVLSE